MGYYAVGQWDLAVEAFKDFIQKFPNSPDAADAQFFTGESYYQSGKTREALAAYTAVVNTYGQSGRVPDAYFKQAMCYELLNQRADAIRVYQLIVKQYRTAAARRSRPHRRSSGSASSSNSGRTPPMGSVNKAILVGNLGRDAELRYTSGGAPVASVRIATTERFTDREGQKREDTQWHDSSSGARRPKRCTSTSSRASRSTSKAGSRRASGPTRKARIGTTPRFAPIASCCWAAVEAAAKAVPPVRPASRAFADSPEPAGEMAHVDAPNDDDIPF